MANPKNEWLTIMAQFDLKPLFQASMRVPMSSGQIRWPSNIYIYSYIPITPCQGHDIYPTSKPTATSQRQVSSQRSITHSYPTTSIINFGLSPLHINPQHVHNVYPTLWGTSCFSFSFSVSSGTTAIGVCPEVEWVATTTSWCANVGYMWVHLGTSHGKNIPKLRYLLEKRENSFWNPAILCIF